MSSAIASQMELISATLRASICVWRRQYA